MTAASSNLMDHCLPTYQFSERHSCRVAADPSTVLEAAAAYRPDADIFFKFAIWLRELPMRLVRTERELAPPFGLYNFTLLARDDVAIIYGLIGQFWKSDYGLRSVIDGEAFRGHREAGVPKLTLAFLVQEDAGGGTRLTTGTRVSCPDPASRRRFAPYWMLIRPVSGLIRRRILFSIKRASEKSLLTA